MALECVQHAMELEDAVASRRGRRFDALRPSPRARHFSSPRPLFRRASSQATVPAVDRASTAVNASALLSRLGRCVLFLTPLLTADPGCV